MELQREKDRIVELTNETKKFKALKQVSYLVLVNTFVVPLLSFCLIIRLMLSCRRSMRVFRKQLQNRRLDWWKWADSLVCKNNKYFKGVGLPKVRKGRKQVFLKKGSKFRWDRLYRLQGACDHKCQAFVRPWLAIFAIVRPVRH